MADPAPNPAARYLADRREALIERTLALVGEDTQNPPGETAAVVDAIEATLSGWGVATERVVADPVKPNLLATIPGASDRTLLYNGHLDTVPFDRERWTHDPFGERDGDRVYGRGATDMKGAVAAMLETAHAYVATGTEPPVTLQFAFVPDEETAGPAGVEALVDADRLDADGCVIGEPTCERGHHSVTVADKGSIWLTLEATGVAAHGSRPMLGENAIDRLYGAVELVRRDVGSMDHTFDPTVRAIVDESVEYYAPQLGEADAAALFEHPTVNLGTISGGNAVNTVPESATAELDIRLSPGVDTTEVLEYVRECCSRHEGVVIADARWSPGSFVALEDPLVDALVATAGAVAGERIYRRSATGGGDAKTLREAGIPAVEFAFGTDTSHAADEYTTVRALADTAEVYARLPVAFGAAVGAGEDE